MTSTSTCTNFNAYTIVKQGQNPAYLSLLGEDGGNIGNNANFSFGSTTCVTEYPNPAATSSILNGFTYGEIVIGLFLFALLLMTFFGGIINHVAGVRLRDFRKHDY